MTSPGAWVKDGQVWRGLFGSPDIITEEPPPPPPPPPGETVPPVFVAEGSKRADVVSIIPPWPAGHQIGHLGIMPIQTCAQVIGTLPSGWAHFPGSPWSIGTGGAAGSTALSILYKFAASVAELALSVGDSGDHQCARIITISGVRMTGNPWDVIAADTLGTASTAFTIPGFTTTVDNCLVLLFVGNATDATADQTLTRVNTGLTISTISEGNTNQGLGGGFSVYKGVKATLGAVPATTGTLGTSTKQVRVAIALAPTASIAPPPPGTFRTMHGVAGLLDADFGITAAPDADRGSTGFSGGFNVVKTGGLIDLARAAGGGRSPPACIAIRAQYANNNLGAPGPFVLQMWKDSFDEFYDGVVSFTGTGSWGTGGIAKLREGIRDGVVRFFWVLDDFASGGSGNSFSKAVTYDELDQGICHHVKVTKNMPWLPLVARAHNSYLLSTATLNGVVRRYQYLDAGWMMWSCKRGPVATWIPAELTAGVKCGLGGATGGILLDGSCVKPGESGCVRGNRTTACGLTTAEILAVGRACLADSRAAGVHWWAYLVVGGQIFYDRAEIQTAIATIDGEMSGRLDGQLNIRGDLAAP